VHYQCQATVNKKQQRHHCKIVYLIRQNNKPSRGGNRIRTASNLELLSTSYNALGSTEFGNCFHVWGNQTTEEGYCVRRSVVEVGFREYLQFLAVGRRVEGRRTMLLGGS